MASLVAAACLLVARGCSLEPGKERREFETIEEVNCHYDGVATESEPEDATWIPEAVLDVAYYLRKFKNNGYDPRYLEEGGRSRGETTPNFSDPPLRNLQWEVKQKCEASFAECLRYLQGRISQTELPRRLDSLTVIRHNGWSLEKDEDLIRATDEACVELRKRDEKTFNAFRGPMHRFRWLATASYFMCWYTMRENAHLRHFREGCDNFADCLDWETGPANGDVRADDAVPFACAAYSFCPDPCCGERLRRGRCIRGNPCADGAVCTLDRSRNRDFDSILFGRWNTSCRCDAPGTRWHPQSGICVDVDECAEQTPPPCPPPAQSCLNLPGSFRCVCSPLGYQEDDAGNCTADSLLQGVLRPRKAAPQRRRKTFADSFFDFVYRVKSILSVSGEADDGPREDRGRGSGTACAAGNGRPNARPKSST